MKELLKRIVTSSVFYLVVGILLGTAYHLIMSEGLKARDELLNKPYESMINAITNTKSGSNVITTVQFVDTGKDIQITTGVEGLERNKL